MYWKEIDIYGPYDTLTGYSEVVRNLCYGLFIKGWNVALKNLEHWAGTPRLRDKIFENVIRNTTFKPICSLNFCLPEQVEQNLHTNTRNVNYTMIECGGTLPAEWLTATDNMDLTLVPSEHCKKIWMDSGVDANFIDICPIGTNTKLFNPTIPAKPLFVRVDNNFVDIRAIYKNRILVLQELITRKNIWCAIRAYFKAWMNWSEQTRKETCLFLKVNSNSGNKFEGFMEAYRELKKKYGISPNVTIYTQFWAEGDVQFYLSNFTHYLTTSYGEGWDITCAKMACMGKQIIAPRSTSYTQYLNDENAYLVDCEVTKDIGVTGPTKRIYRNSVWYSPNEEQVVGLLSKINELPLKCSDYVAKNFNVSVTTDRLIEAMNPKKEVVYTPKSDKENIMLYCNSARQICGIADYNSHMAQSLMAHKANLVSVGGPPFSLLKVSERFDIKYLINQMQYDFFYHSERAKIFFRGLRDRKIKLINIMHTFVRECYSMNDLIYEYSDAIVTHNPNVINEFKRLGHDGNKVKFMHYPCRFLEYNPMECISEDIPSDHKFVIGTFGFTFFHKGLNELLILTKKLNAMGMPTHLLMLCTTTERDNVKYHEQVEQLIESCDLRNHVTWIKEHLPEEKIIATLRKASAIVLNYYDYGGMGASAALRTLLNTGKPPIFMNANSPFFDDVKVIKQEMGGEMGLEFYNNIDELLNLFTGGVFFDCTEKRNELITKYHIDNFTRQIIDLCRSL